MQWNSQNFDLLSGVDKEIWGLFLCFDITNKKSFEDISLWLKNKMNEKIKHNIFMLIGCKSDLENERKVTKEEAQELANEMNIEYYEVSSKENINVDFIFERMADLIYEKCVS